MVARFKGVAFGSYPYFNHPEQTTEHLTIVTVDAPDRAATEGALAALLAATEASGHGAAVLKVTKSWEAAAEERP